MPGWINDDFADYVNTALPYLLAIMGVLSTWSAATGPQRVAWTIGFVIVGLVGVFAADRAQKHIETKILGGDQFFAVSFLYGPGMDPTGNSLLPSPIRAKYQSTTPFSPSRGRAIFPKTDYRFRWVPFIPPMDCERYQCLCRSVITRLICARKRAAGFSRPQTRRNGRRQFPPNILRETNWQRATADGRALDAADERAPRGRDAASQYGHYLSAALAELQRAFPRRPHHDARPATFWRASRGDGLGSPASRHPFSGSVSRPIFNHESPENGF